MEDEIFPDVTIIYLAAKEILALMAKHGDEEGFDDKEYRNRTAYKR